MKLLQELVLDNGEMTLKISVQMEDTDDIKTFVMPKALREDSDIQEFVAITSLYNTMTELPNVKEHVSIIPAGLMKAVDDISEREETEDAITIQS